MRSEADIIRDRVQALFATPLFVNLEAHTILAEVRDLPIGDIFAGKCSEITGLSSSHQGVLALLLAGENSLRRDGIIVDARDTGTNYRKSVAYKAWQIESDVVIGFVLRNLEDEAIVAFTKQALVTHKLTWDAQGKNFIELAERFKNIILAS
jgi:hypothetical protein